MISKNYNLAKLKNLKIIKTIPRKFADNLDYEYLWGSKKARRYLYFEVEIQYNNQKHCHDKEKSMAQIADD